MNDDRKIAVLIDGDNAQYSLIDETLKEVAKQGKISIKRVYGDWSRRNLKGWKEQLDRFALKPVQQFAFTKGKNSTDIALVIDAMDILHTRKANGFCIVSSDSDYTGLANRIREEGIFVMGVGQEKTPEAFVKACELFIYTENLEEEEIVEEEKPVKETGSRAPKPSRPKKRKKPIPGNMIRAAFNAVVEENEKASLSRLGEALRKMDPGFDPRTYGFPLLSKLIKSMNQYEVTYSDNLDTAYVERKRKK